MKPIQAQVTRLAIAYGLTRQRIYQIQATHQIPLSDFEFPEKILGHLFAAGRRSSQLRRRLSDPAALEQIKSYLHPA